MRLWGGKGVEGVRMRRPSGGRQWLPTEVKPLCMCPRAVLRNSRGRQGPALRRLLCVCEASQGAAAERWIGASEASHDLDHVTVTTARMTDLFAASPL